MTQSVTDSGTRGPADHNVRDQIVEAAMQHFAHYGYEKTTVSDLARAIGFSKPISTSFLNRNRRLAKSFVQTDWR